MTLRARLTLHAETELSDQIAFVTPSALARLVSDHILTDGTSTGEANAVFAERFTLSPEETEVIDLGGLTDDLGQSLRFSAVKWVMVKAADANTAAATLKPNTAEPWLAPFNAVTDTLNIAAEGGAIALVNAGTTGWLVAEDSADKLLLSNPSTTATLDIDVVIVGVGVFE